MNHLKWMGHSATILDIHKNLRDELDSCEVTLVGKGQSVKAHRFVLSSCSDLMKSLLTDIPRGQECCIMVPDIKGKLLENILAFIYFGECSLTSTNLSEFLEAINILGIKSAISFECATNSLQSTQSEADSNIPESKQLAAQQDELQHNVVNDDGQEANQVSAGGGRSIEFLNVYHEPQHKITYSIEHVPGTANGANEFILTENSESFTFNHNPKLETTSSAESTNMEVNEDDGSESHLIEGYSSSEEQLIQSAPVAPMLPQASSTLITATSTLLTPPHQGKEIKIKSIKAKYLSTPANIPKIEKTVDEFNTEYVSSADVSMINTANESYAFMKDNSNSLMNTTQESLNFSTPSTAGLSNADLAYQAIVNEGMSLPKAAVKFNVSKAELWRRVRSTGVVNLQRSVPETTQKTIKTDPGKLDIIELACQAVINEGLSLQKAAAKFDISKTVLWRRVRKHPMYMKTARANPVITKAYERLKMGESLKSISQDLDIPMSTLHRHKVRLSQQGELPIFVSCKKRDTTARDTLKEKLAQAVHACVHEGMSQNHAANLFEISKSTLWRHLQRRVAEAEADHSEAAEHSVEESMEDEEVNIKTEEVLS